MNMSAQIDGHIGKVSDTQSENSRSRSPPPPIELSEAMENIEMRQGLKRTRREPADPQGRTDSSFMAVFLEEMKKNREEILMGVGGQFQEVNGALTTIKQSQSELVDLVRKAQDVADEARQMAKTAMSEIAELKRKFEELESKHLLSSASSAVSGAAAGSGLGGGGPALPLGSAAPSKW